MDFRQLFYKESSTYTYLLADHGTREAVVIDPVLDQVERDLNLLEELSYRLCYALDTHVHADHISALGRLRERTNCQTVMSAQNGATCADIRVRDGDSVRCGDIRLDVIETPGHTAGCVTFKVDKRIFTGDSLLIRGCGRVDFQGGNAELLYASIIGKLFCFPDDTEVYPGHDYNGYSHTTIGEERRFNPRLTKSQDEFVDLMKNLNLPDPKMMMAAVPINLRCGKET